MKSPKVKQLLLEELKKKPVVESACLKVGISRTTFYEWKGKDKKFSEAVDMALEFGEAFICDIAEMQLFNMIKREDYRAIALWLKTHHPKYRQKVEVEGVINTIQELNDEQKAVVEKALSMFGVSDQNDGSESD